MKKQNEIPAGHPLRSAKWIWPEAYMYMHNHFAQFRRDFELDVAPKSAITYITADKAYRLYVNGVPVCRGPARGFQTSWPFDEVDLAKYLKVGRNWISIEGYNPGTGTFQYIHHSQAGLLFAAVWGETKILSGDKGWVYRRSPGHNRNTARYSLQIDYQEDIDLSVDDRNWITSPEQPKEWNPRYAPHAQLFTDIAFGRPPWDSVEERGIPMLREEIITPVGVTAQAEGVSGSDYLTRSNISWGWANEGRQISSWQTGKPIATVIKGNWLEIILEPTGKGQFRAVTLDLDQITVGVLSFEIDNALGGEIVDFQHDQILRNGEPIFIKEGGACSVAMANRAKLRTGANAHEFFHPLGFQNVTVIARDLSQPLKLRVRVRSALYPFSMTGSFESSDETLNRIHAACRKTQQLCALDAYVDTPWREQAQWWGDARVQARNTFYLDGDVRLLVRGIRQIGTQRTKEGLTYGHAPTIAYSCILPDFSLTWILTVYDYYWQTGDLNLFHEQWPGIQKVLAYFASDSARDSTGLLRYDRRFWLFEDWAPLFKNEIPTFLNLWYIYTLRHLVDLLEIAGNEKEALIWKKEAERNAELAIKHLFDRESGMFYGGLYQDGKPELKCSVHDQVLSLILNLVPASDEIMMSKMIMPYLEGQTIDGPTPSAFWSTYLFEEATKRGAGLAVVEFIRKKWTPMLTTGTTWEGFSWSETAGESCTHAWTAHPSYHLVNTLAGLTQTECAWRGIRFEPLFPDGISNAKAVIPSFQGAIEASWKRDAKNSIHAELTLPVGVTADVILPNKKVQVKGPGIFKFD